MGEFSLRNSTGRPCLGEIQADCQPCCPFETDVRCLSMRYSRILGGKIEFSGRTPPRERKGETGWGRRLDSNSRLSFLNTLSKRARTRSRALWRRKAQVRP